MARVLRRATAVSVLALVLSIPVAGQDATPSPTTLASADPSASDPASGLCPTDHRVVALEGSGQATVSPEPVATPSPAATSAPTPTPATSPAPIDPSVSSLPDLGGTWSKLPRSPFAALSPIALWAGDVMVAIDRSSGRTATYDPSIRRWEEHQPLPVEPATSTRSFEGVSGAVGAGDEVIARGLYMGPDDAWSEWYAFDAATGRWRTLAPSPLADTGLLAWTGEFLVEVTHKRHAAAYDPAADCWLAMPDMPPPALAPDAAGSPDTGWRVGSLHWTGTQLLVVVPKGGPRTRLGVVAFDPRTWQWDPGPQGPLRSGSDAILADGQLWFMDRDGHDRWATNGTYDPATETWTVLDTGCRLDARFAIWTGRLVMEPYARRAYDPATGTCYRLLRPRDRARSGIDPVWTGREYVVWSGAWGDADVAYRDGLVYRPPRRAITAEPAQPIGTKLARAIKARRRSGFDTDPDVVRAIRRDPYQPASREYGFPMTEDEYWDLNDRSWFSSQLEPVLHYLQRLPIRGGEWIDQRHGGRLAVALTEADPDVIAELDRLMPTEPDLGWKLVIVERSQRELRTAQRRAPRVSRELDPAAMLWSWGVDVKNGAVTLMYDPDDVGRMRPRKKELEQALGVPVRITAGRVREV